MTSLHPTLPSTLPHNYTFHAIAGAYTLALPPLHMIYQLAKGMTASDYTITNIVPRTNLELLKPKLDSTAWSRLARARGVHLNGLEGFPLFAAAMIAGNDAEMEVKELSLCAAEYSVARVVFAALCMGVARSEAWRYARGVELF